MAVLGFLLFLGGVAVLYHYWVVFDTSVGVFGGRRVNNLGLMGDRQNGIFIGAIIAVLGFISALVSSIRK